MALIGNQLEHGTHETEPTAVPCRRKRGHCHWPRNGAGRAFLQRGRCRPQLRPGPERGPGRALAPSLLQPLPLAPRSSALPPHLSSSLVVTSPKARQAGPSLGWPVAFCSSPHPALAAGGGWKATPQPRHCSGSNSRPWAPRRSPQRGQRSPNCIAVASATRRTWWPSAARRAQASSPKPNIATPAAANSAMAMP
jgi:hypothetical protein